MQAKVQDGPPGTPLTIDRVFFDVRFSWAIAAFLFGLLMEQVNRPGDRVNWSPFAFVSLAGAVPWVAITIALVVAQGEGDGVPGFVYFAGTLAD